MTARVKLAHDSGKRRALDRQQPRKSKRDQPGHADKYASEHEDPTEREMSEKLAALVAKFNGEEADSA